MTHPVTSVRIQAMRKRLEAALSPCKLTIIDKGPEHAGHAGAKTGLGHFLLRVYSQQFDNKPLIACHRMVYDALGSMMQSDIHALTIELCKTPDDKALAMVS